MQGGSRGVRDNDTKTQEGVARATGEEAAGDEMSPFWKSGRSGDDESDSQCKEMDSLPIPPSCGICFMPISRNTKAILQPCFHCFHFDCIDRWLSVRRYCAYCRTTEPHVRHNFTSSIDFSTKFYDDREDSLELDDDDLEVLDYWGDGEEEEEEESVYDAGASGGSVLVGRRLHPDHPVSRESRPFRMLSSP